MDYNKEIKEIISSSKDELNKKIEFIAVITAAIQETLDITPIIVGGHAVEFYTTGGYSTMNIDIICKSPISKLDKLFKELGFKKEQRYWIYDSKNLELAIELFLGPLAGDRNRITKVHTPDGYTAYFIGIEDVIIDRLNAYVHWNEKWQEEWILGMMVTNYEDIDWEYLKKRSSQEGVNDSLKRMVVKAEEIIKAI